MIHNKEETLSRAKLAQLQLQNLQESVLRVQTLVPFYQKKFTKLGISANGISSLEDIAKLPFTKKQDLRDNYPFGLFAVDIDQVVRVHSSSGTTGKPTVVGYTEHDMDIWCEVMARVFRMGGVTSRDIFHNATGYGLFTGGLGFHTAAERLKIAVIPSSTGFTSRQLLLLKDFGATAIHMTPSFALHLAEKAKKEGYNIKEEFKLHTGFFGAESASLAMKEQIQELWGIDYHEVYGLSEIIGPGVAANCKHSRDLHIFEDHFYPEIIDPKTGKVLPEGEEGELVITTLTKHALPLIRYRTGDITCLHYEPCRCGRTLVRMESVKGRSDDMLLINGVNVFPSQIEHVLGGIKGLSLNYQIIAGKKGYLDSLEIDIEVDEEMITDSTYELEQLKKHLEAELLNNLYIHAKVKLVEPHSIARSEGKAVRIVDTRKEEALCLV